MAKRVYGVLAAWVLFAALAVFLPERAKAAPDLGLEVRAALLVDARTGRILYQDAQIDTPYPPASMTKMMTEYLILEAIQNGKLHWDDVLTADEAVYNLGRKRDSSGVFLNLGEKHTVRELFEAMAIYSANDATVMLAEGLAGSETDFVRLMNEKAKGLGLTNTHFVTSTGYPEDELGDFRPNIDGEQQMSARDAALLGLALVRDHPEVLEFTSVARKKFPKDNGQFIDMINYNKLLPGLAYAYEGVDGLKTGHTDKAKYSVTATAKRGEMRLIAVVIGAESEAKRAEAARKLFDYGFQSFDYVTLAQKGESLPDVKTFPVAKGKARQVEVVLGADVVDVAPKNGDAPSLNPKLNAAPLVAPVKAETAVGVLDLQNDALPYISPAYAQAAAVPLVAKDDVPKANPIALFFRAVMDFLGNLFGRIVASFGGRP